MGIWRPPRLRTATISSTVSTQLYRDLVSLALNALTAYGTRSTYILSWFGTNPHPVLLAIYAVHVVPVQRSPACRSNQQHV